MEHRVGKFEKMETQSEFVEDYFSHIPMGVLHAGDNTGSERICDKVLAIVHSYLSYFIFTNKTLSR